MKEWRNGGELLCRLCLLVLLGGCGGSETVGNDSSEMPGDVRFAPSDSKVYPDSEADERTSRQDAPAGETETDTVEVHGAEVVLLDAPAVEDLAAMPEVTDNEVEQDLFVEEIPPPDVDLSSACSPAGDGVLNVFDLQDPSCPDHPSPEPTGPPGLKVDLSDMVVTARFSKLFFVQDAAGGPWSGMAVYSHNISTSELSPGTIVDVSGAYQEFYGLSEMYLDSFTVVAQGAEPAPYDIGHPSYIATDGPLAEPFESVLVRVIDVTVTNTKPDCPHEFGEFMVTGELRIDDLGQWNYDAAVGDVLASVTGPLNYGFGNAKLEPRNDADIDVSHKGQGGATKCINTDCIVSLEAAETGELVVNDILVDPLGLDAQLEWFEVYNPGPAPVDMSGWKIRNCAVLEVTLTEGEAPVIPPKGYAVFGPEGDPAVNGGVTVSYVYSGESFYLPNTEGSILLFDQTGKLVDQVRFASFGGWPYQTGASLELADPGADNTMPTSWAAALTTYGPTDNKGTPGEKNSTSQ